MKTEKRTDFLISFFESFSLEGKGRTYETDLNNRVGIKSDISRIKGIKITIICCFDTISDVSFEICYRRLNIVNIINGYVAELINVTIFD